MAKTGNLGEFGLPIGDGVRLAAEEINKASRGLNLSGEPGLSLVVGEQPVTWPVALLSRNTKATPEGGFRALSRVLDAHPDAAGIVGALASGVTLAAAGVARDRRVVMVSPASTSPDLAAVDDGDFLFRTVPSDRSQARFMAQQARQRGYRRAVVLYADNAYGSAFADQLQAEFGELMGDGAHPDERLLDLIPAAEGQISYAAVLARAFAATPDVLFFVGYPVDGALIVSEWHSHPEWYGTRWIISDGLKGEQFVQAAGAAVVEGMLGTAPAPVAGPEHAAFAARYEARFGRAPGVFVANGYDAAMLIALATQAAGSLDGGLIRDQLRKVASGGEPHGATELPALLSSIRQGDDVLYQGVSGLLEMDENGDPRLAAYRTWWVEDGEICDEGSGDPARCLNPP